MKLKLTTVYENVSEQWIFDWLHQGAGPNYGFDYPWLTPNGKLRHILFPHTKISFDPTDETVKGTTLIELIKEGE
jgi:hypothetical protein